MDVAPFKKKHVKENKGGLCLLPAGHLDDGQLPGARDVSGGRVAVGWTLRMRNPASAPPTTTERIPLQSCLMGDLGLNFT